MRKNSLSLAAVTILLAAPIVAQTAAPYAVESDYVVELLMSVGDERDIQGRVMAGNAIRVALGAEGKAFGIVPRVVDFGTRAVELTVYALDPNEVESGELGREVERLQLAEGEQASFRHIPNSHVLITGFARVSPQELPAFRFTSSFPDPVVAVGANPCCVTCGNVTTCGCGVQMSRADGGLTSDV